MRPSPDRRPSAPFALLALLIANLVPLAGVYFWGWSLTDLLMLYWLENAVIGLFTVFGILAARPEGGEWWRNLAAKLFTVPFFLVHYGTFWVGHGVFLSIFFGGGSPFGGGAGGASRFLGGAEGSLFSPSPLLSVWDRLDLLAWPLLGMVLSHGVSFFTNFLASGEYRQVTASQVMTRPYGRVVVLHVTIVIGGFMVMGVGQSLGVLVLFVGVKIVADVMALLQEQRRVAEQARSATLTFRDAS